VIFGHSTHGKYWDMDIDCDGAKHLAGKCANDPSGQNVTAFQDQIKSISGGAIGDLNSNIHPYVVFGNDGSSPSFDPQSKGMVPLSVMAVVCNGQLVSTAISWLLVRTHHDKSHLPQ
jgi:chitosanase